MQMHKQDDLELLRLYAIQNSEEAFTELVQRKISLVYSVASGQLRNPALAEDATQAVFIALAKKAGSFRSGANVSAWLYRATRFTASNMLKLNLRRAQREQRLAEMQSLPSESDRTWEEISSVLDEVLLKLSKKDRTAVLLRFFENKSLAEIGVALGASEAAARKRLARALEKLRVMLSGRGTALSGVALETLLSANASQAAPAGLTASTAAVATASAAYAPAVLLGLAEATLKSLFWAKVRIVSACGSVVASAIAIGLVFLGNKSNTQAQIPQSFEFEASGEVEQTRYFAVGPDGTRNPSRLEVAAFTVFVRNSNWFIQLIDKKTPNKILQESNDGQWWYAYARQDLRINDLEESAFIARGDMVPFQAPTSFIPTIWLAFASASYLDQHPHSLVTPYLTGNRPILEVDMTRRKDRVRLPERIAFYKSANEDETSNTLPSKPHLPENEDAIYVGLQFTNINGIHLPLAFELTKFSGEMLNENPSKRRPEIQWTGKITDIKPSCSISSFVPNLPSDQNTIIRDMRLQLPSTTPGADAISFKTNKWPSLTAVTNHPDFSRFMSVREFAVAYGGGVVHDVHRGTWHWKGARLIDGTMATPIKPKLRIYDESADGTLQISEALALAKRENKRILLQLGANWCSWCHKLHNLFESNSGIREKLKANFIVVLINVDLEPNSGFSERFGGRGLGIPLLVVLDRDGKHLATKGTGELEEGDQHDPQKVLSFLNEWAAR
jgi:RNA polymerase sigma factor (sigma-70 family)